MYKSYVFKKVPYSWSYYITQLYKGIFKKWTTEWGLHEKCPGNLFCGLDIFLLNYFYKFATKSYQLLKICGGTVLVNWNFP